MTYNHVKYISQALDSILMQDVDFKYEILVGDDGSTDGTQSIVKEYARNYPEIFRVFLRKKNLGATKNLYDLQMKAMGQYIAYLEGDDFWVSNQKLKIQVSFLDKNTAYIGCTHVCVLSDASGRILKASEPNWICKKKHYTIRDFKGIFLPGHVNSLVHRNIFQDFDGMDYKGLITIHPLIGDRSLFLLLASKGNLYRFQEKLGCYRIQSSGSGQNATAVAYQKNKNHVRDDYQYTVMLEKYARDILHIDGGFAYHKRDLFVSGVWDFLRGPTESKLRVLWQILRDGSVVTYLCYFPVGTIRKVIQKFIKRGMYYA